MSFYKKIPLLAKLILAVTLGIVLGSFLPLLLLEHSLLSHQFSAHS